MSDDTKRSGIEEATSRFLEGVDGLDPSAWTAVPSPGGWSVSQIVEHVAIANTNVLGVLERHLEPIDAAPDIVDAEMPYLFYGGDEPPNAAAPTGTWSDIDVAVHALQDTANALIEWAHACSLDLRSYGFAHPAFGLLDGEQWLRFPAVHTWRHRTQARAVRRAVAL